MGRMCDSHDDYLDLNMKRLTTAIDTMANVRRPSSCTIGGSSNGESSAKRLNNVGKGKAVMLRNAGSKPTLEKASLNGGPESQTHVAVELQAQEEPKVSNT
ncbi:hypothetical protein ACH5RR_015237 [Cinchona calisaya]|uniref:Uncharacterized protein n=1 Tax=Cinchona calisaya TaxID=153742 RepID=A0ABD2ZSZ2_9GENT